MKILQVTNFFKPSFEAGGVARVAYNISKHLVNNGHEVTVFTTNRSFKDIKVEANKALYIEGIKVYYFENLRKYISVRIPPIPYYLLFVVNREVQNFDIIHIHEHRSLLALIVYHYAKKHNVPYILQAHGSIPNIIGKENQKDIYDRIWGKKILRDASKLIAVSNIEVDQYKQIGVPDKKIIVIPNGVDIDLPKELPKKGYFKKKFSISEKHIILYLGRLDKRKGIDFLIKSYAELKKEMGNTVLVLAGSDNGYKYQVKKAIEDSNLTKNVILTDYIDENEKVAAYVDADILVYPSTLEIFGLVPFEAIMCGTPVIVTDDCGCGELVKEAKCGELVKYGDIYELKEKIKNLLENPEMRERYTINGMIYIQNNLKWNILIDKMVKDVYNLESKKGDASL